LHALGGKLSDDDGCLLWLRSSAVWLVMLAARGFSSPLGFWLLHPSRAAGLVDH
jgi:hypothetical protein